MERRECTNPYDRRSGELPVFFEIEIFDAPRGCGRNPSATVLTRAMSDVDVAEAHGASFDCARRGDAPPIFAFRRVGGSVWSALPEAVAAFLRRHDSDDRSPRCDRCVHVGGRARTAG